MGFKVLIVDDSAVMRKIVLRALQQIGLPIDNVVEVGDGQEALTALEANPIDLVLSDINMPNMDGLQFIKAMNEKGLSARIPVIMITTEGSESKVMEAIQFGAKGYIKKPFSADQLQERVKSVLAI